MKGMGIRFLGLAFCLQLSCGWASTYRVIDLGTLGGETSRAAGLNDKNQVVGSSLTSDGAEHAFLWETNHMLDLGTLGGTNSAATAINSSGQIAGWAQTSAGVSNACLFAREGNKNLKPDPYHDSVASAINDAGEVVGWWVTKSDGTAYEAYLFAPEARLLPGGNSKSKALAINNDGQIVGFSSDAAWITGQMQHAAEWHGASSDLFLTDASESVANGISDSGVGCGWAATDYFDRRATAWSFGTGFDLGSLAGRNSVALRINNSLEIVGSSDAYVLGTVTTPLLNLNGGVTGSVTSTQWVMRAHAFISRDGGLFDLNDLIPADSGWELNEAAAINEDGAIVGTGTFGGKERAFLLMPDAAQTDWPHIEITSMVEEGFTHETNITFRANVFGGASAVKRVDYFMRRVQKLANPVFFSRPTFTLFQSLFEPPDPTRPPGYAGSLTEPPYELRATGIASGNYALSARLVTESGISVWSRERILKVSGPPHMKLISMPWLDGQGAMMQSFTVEGNEEVEYDVLASDDLIHWTATGTYGGGYPQVVRLDILSADIPKYKHRFYKVMARQ